MKKILFAIFALATFAFGADEGSLLGSYTTLAACSILGSSILLGIAALGGAVGMGNTTSATITGMARNPSVASRLSTTMFISVALIEAQVIYALVITFILLFANPLITDTISSVVAG